MKTLRPVRTNLSGGELDCLKTDECSLKFISLQIRLGHANVLYKWKRREFVSTMRSI